MIFLGSGQAFAQTHVKIGIISPTFGHAPFYVARAKGFYNAEGLVGEVIVMNRDDLILQSLVSDSIQFGNISPGAYFPARDQGLTDLKMIAGSFNGTTYSIIANAKFKTLEQLKGLLLAVSSLQAGSPRRRISAGLQARAGRRPFALIEVDTDYEFVTPTVTLADLAGKKLAD